MKIAKKELKVLYLATVYFLLIGFGVLFVVNLLLGSLVWPFFQNITFVFIFNLLFSLLALYLAILFLSSIFNERLRGYGIKPFLIIASLEMFLAIIGTNYLFFFNLSSSAKIMQIIYSCLLWGGFCFFSYSHIKKEE